MTFATRADLLARSNARRLLQLAVPTDAVVPPDEALRVAIDGDDVTVYSNDEQTALTLALDAIDKALADANELIVSYGIPDAAQSTLIARLCSTIALYYLQGAERMTDDVSKAYEGAIGTLKAHARGDLNLLPLDPALPLLPEDQVLMTSNTRRYGTGASAVPGD
jgi:phage gp36-like protein